MQDDKLGNKTAYEEERLLRMREKQKSCLITLDQLEVMPFFLTKLIFSHSYVN